MLINKRIGIFETNSSSSHSVSVSINNNNLKCCLKKYDEDGFIVIRTEGGEFGWEVDYFQDAETKLSYLITYIFRNFDISDIDEDINKMTPSEQCKILNSLNLPKYLNKSDYELYQKLEKIICKFCTCDKLRVEIKSKFYLFGYIDHQSTNIAYDILQSNEEYILNFIFNPESILKTDNDNRWDIQ